MQYELVQQNFNFLPQRAASNLPVVRSQTLIHILDWLKVAAKEGFEPTTFAFVKVLYSKTPL